MINLRGRDQRESRCLNGQTDYSQLVVSQDYHQDEDSYNVNKLRHLNGQTSQNQNSWLNTVTPNQLSLILYSNGGDNPTNLNY